NNLNFERTVSLVGFNKFQTLDPEVQHIDLWGCSDGIYEMDVNVSVNNPSTMGLQGIGALNMSVNQTFRVVMSENSSALEGVITGFFSGGIEVNARGDNPYSTEYTQFKEAISKVNMTVEYDDGLEKVSFNTSCVSSFLTVLGY
ncbi:Hypothetical protein PHPALM_13075, partial [Phytophthora palmivora]